MALKTIQLKVELSAVSLSEKHLITGAIDGSIFIFAVETTEFGPQVKLLKDITSHKSYINSICTNNGLAIAGSKGGKVLIYDLDNLHSTKASILTAVENREVSICSVNMNSIGDTIVAACDTGHLFTWNVETEEKTLIFDAFGRSILCTQFSPDSPFLLATGDSEGCIRFHDLRTYPSHFESIVVTSAKTNSTATGPNVSPASVSIRCLTYTQGANCIAYGTLNRERDNFVGLCDIRAKAYPVSNLFKTEAGCLSMVSSFQSNRVFVTHEDGYVNRVDYNLDELTVTRSERINITGKFDRKRIASPVNFIDSCAQNQLFVTAGWAKKVKIWNGNHFDSS